MAKILTVDDSDFLRNRIKGMLEKNSFAVVEASNGLQALDVYKKENPDIVLMDITMPEMDGITAIEKLLELDSNAKVIVLSAMGQKHMVMQAIQKGAVNFLVKPFNPEKVLATLKHHLG